MGADGVVTAVLYGLGLVAFVLGVAASAFDPPDGGGDELLDVAALVAIAAFFLLSLPALVVVVQRRRPWLIFACALPVVVGIWLYVQILNPNNWQ
jgi:hypothetical protein